ncbi:MAG TPA: DUF177 domain-containing protein [Chloroflexota bacterium]|nr:DUF177 domain-containing protein [Chloroflexota bacterium]
MDYNVSDLLRQPIGTTRDHDVDAEPCLTLDDDLAADVMGGRVRLERTSGGTRASGVVRATVTLPCARCLEPVPAILEIPFEEEFAPSVDPTTGRPLPEPEDDLIFTIDAHQTLHLDEAVRQNLIAALPIQPLCRLDCAGLCPACGSNRNAAPCACVLDEGHRPFAALADLLH